MDVIKKDGSIVEFDYKKMFRSILSAYMDGYNPNKLSQYKKGKLEESAKKSALEAAKNIVSKKRDNIPNTNEIRVEVEKALMQNDYDAAKKYILYLYKGSDKNVEFQIKVTYIKDVSKIVSIAMSVPGQISITVKQGKYVVDAKSIMGIFSLDLSSPITVCLESDYAVNYDYYKKQFAPWIVGESQ